MFIGVIFCGPKERLGRRAKLIKTFQSVRVRRIRAAIAHELIKAAGHIGQIPVALAKTLGKAVVDRGGDVICAAAIRHFKRSAVGPAVDIRPRKIGACVIHVGNWLRVVD